MFLTHGTDRDSCFFSAHIAAKENSREDKIFSWTGIILLSDSLFVIYSNFLLARKIFLISDKYLKLRASASQGAILLKAKLNMSEYTNSHQKTPSEFKDGDTFKE